MHQPRYIYGPAGRNHIVAVDRLKDGQRLKGGGGGEKKMMAGEISSSSNLERRSRHLCVAAREEGEGGGRARVQLRRLS